MTLRQMVEYLLDDEGPFESPDITAPRVAIGSVFQILRSINQREKATDEGCAASMIKFVETYGEPTRENVLLFCTGKVFEIDLPGEMILEYLED